MKLHCPGPGRPATTSWSDVVWKLGLAGVWQCAELRGAASHVIGGLAGVWHCPDLRGAARDFIGGLAGVWPCAISGGLRTPRWRDAWDVTGGVHCCLH